MSKCTPANRLNQLFPGTASEVDSLLSQFLTGPTCNAIAARSAWSTPASVWEADEKLHVELDVPGVKSNAVDVTVENGQLTITVERKPGEGAPKPLYNERRFGSVTRSLDLPDTVDPETVEASLTDGVLSVSIAKRPETQPRKIEVRNG